MFGFSSPPLPAPRGNLPFDGFASRSSPPNNLLSQPPSESDGTNERASSSHQCTNQFFLSPDGRSHHSYYDGNVISCFAPFNNDSTKITTVLPAVVQRAVNIDPILGFICAGEASKEKDMNVLPWMCLYTSASAFLFSIGYTQDNVEGADVKGIILRLVEPFEKPLLSPLSPQIVCVQSAPEISRAGAMACMLKENDGYSLVMYHGIENDSPVTTTTTLRISRADLLRGRSGVDAENLAYDSSQIQVIDFCFVSFASILILSNDGGVYGASPILFDGICVPRSEVVPMVTRLDHEIDVSSAMTSGMTMELEARLRQCKAARRYWMDAFGLDTVSDSYYVSASVLHGKRAVSQAMTWQPRIQGPFVMISSEEKKNMSCQCIEGFGEGDLIKGFVVASHDEASTVLEVGFGIVPAHEAVLLPRFEFESDNDCHSLDRLVRDTGVIVERVLINNAVEGEENEGAITTASRAIESYSSGVSLITDPLDEQMVHIITKSRIATVSTTALNVTSKCFQDRLDGRSKRDANADMDNIRTKLWTSFDSTCRSLVGAGVSKDVHLGHILLANLSNGSTEVVNITTLQCIHEASLQMETRMERSLSQSTPDVLKNVKPLYELLQPLTDKLCKGLDNLGKIVGGNTKPKDVGPEDLAVFLETKRSCGQNIILPMEEMSIIIKSRKDFMVQLSESQSVELQRLTKLIDELKTKHESNRRKVAELEAESAILTSRSSAVLTATLDLRPHITDAEVEYFRDLKRYESSCNKWEEQVKQITNNADSMCKAMSDGAIESGEICCLADLSRDKMEMCVKMLKGEKEMMKKTEHRINQSTSTLNQLSPADIARQRSMEDEKENIRHGEQ